MSYAEEQIGILNISGNPARFVSTERVPVSNLTVNIEPVQDMNGYDYQWAGGEGKNLIQYPFYETTHENNGITWTDNGDGTITANGKATADSSFNLTPTFAGQNFPTNNEVYSLSTGVTGCSSTTYFITGYAGETASNGKYFQSLTINDTTIYSDGYTIDTDGYPKFGRFYIRIKKGVEVENLTFKPMFCLGEEILPYEPYANICPFIPQDSVSVYVGNDYSVKDETDVYNISFNDEIYGGIVTVDENGDTILSNLYGHIESYDGETLTGKWLSDRDVYSVGSVPTTGAEVLYELEQPVTSELDNVYIVTLAGMNYVWTSLNNNINISLPYKKEIQPMGINYNYCWTYPKAYIDKLEARIKALEDLTEQNETNNDESEDS